MPVLEHGFRSLLTADSPNVAPPSIRGLCTLGLAAAALLLGCGGSRPSPVQTRQVEVPEDMPDICQGLDFNRDVEYRELCGVKARDYLAYRNIPEHRNLLHPKGGKIVKKGRLLELRLENTLPAPLPAELAGRIVFDEKRRRTYLKSRMDYCEFFPENSPHNVKVIKLDIPQDTGGELVLCYTVESSPMTAQRKTGFASRLEPLDCAEFQRIKLRLAAQETGLPKDAVLEMPRASE